MSCPTCIAPKKSGLIFSKLEASKHGEQALETRREN